MAEQEKPRSAKSTAGGGLPRISTIPPNSETLATHGASSSSGALLMPRAFNLTMPEEDEIYGVKAEQLDALSAGGRSMALDWGLFFLGAWLGFVPQAISSALRESPMNGWSIAGLCPMAVFLALSATKLLEHHRQKSDTSTLLAKIKAGQKLRVG